MAQFFSVVTVKVHCTRFIYSFKYYEYLLLIITKTNKNKTFVAFALIIFPSKPEIIGICKKSNSLKNYFHVNQAQLRFRHRKYEKSHENAAEVSRE